MSKLSSWIAGQLFGCEAKKLLETGLFGLVKGYISANPSATLSNVLAMIDSHASVIFNKILVVAKIPTWAIPFVEPILESVLNDLATSLYDEATRRCPPTSN